MSFSPQEKGLVVLVVVTRLAIQLLNRYRSNLQMDFYF